MCCRYLKPDNSKKSKRKTHTLKKTLNPEFNEVRGLNSQLFSLLRTALLSLQDFAYKITSQELRSRSLEVTVWDYDIGKRNDYIGGIVIGNESKGDKLQHWFSIFKDPGQRHEMWHVLSAELKPESPA